MRKRKRKTAVLAEMILILILMGMFSGQVAYASEPSDAAGNLPVILRASKGQKDSRSVQTSLGGAAADGARELCGADAAILNGGDLYANLLPGEVTFREVEECFARDQNLCVVRVTPAELKSILEQGLSRLTLDKETLALDYEASAYDGFPQVSGFSYLCDLTEPVGKRVREIKMQDGTILDLEDKETVLTLAGSQYMFSGGYGYDARNVQEPAGITQIQALAAYISSGKINSRYDGVSRAKVIGNTDDTIASGYPVGLMALAAIVMILLTSHPIIKRTSVFQNGNER